MSASDRSPLTSTVPSECWGDAASHYAGCACHESAWAAKLAAAEREARVNADYGHTAALRMNRIRQVIGDTTRDGFEYSAAEIARAVLAECDMPMEPELRRLIAAEERIRGLEAALKEIAVRPCLTGGEVTGDYRTCPELGSPTREHWCAGCIARRALAKGEDRG